MLSHCVTIPYSVLSFTSYTGLGTLKKERWIQPEHKSQNNFFFYVPQWRRYLFCIVCPVEIFILSKELEQKVS